MRPKRVLHIVSSMGRGGAEALIMDIYRNIDQSKIQFDFITHSKDTLDYDDEIKSLGGEIYNIPSLGTIGPFRYLKQLIQIMSQNNYSAIHAHTDYQSGFPALAAKICGIKNRICHSHSNNWLKNDGIRETAILKILQLMIQATATKLCSCSEEAAGFLFGKNKKHVQILNNGINIDKYIEVDVGSRRSIIRELKLPADVKVIGHIGKFSESKNQRFILKVLSKLIEENPSFVAILIGDGPLRESIEMEAVELGLQNHIRFVGVQSDVPRWIKAFDVFLFPSLFEGFGIVTLEAQCSGIPCVASTAVPAITDMGIDIVSYVDLESPIEKWCESIQIAIKKVPPNNSTIVHQITEKGFNIKENVNDWLNLYGIAK